MRSKTIHVGRALNCFLLQHVRVLVVQSKSSSSHSLRVMYPARGARPSQQMPKCLDNVVGLSVFIVEIHLTEKLLVEPIGPDLVICRGTLEQAQDLETEILDVNLTSLISVCVNLNTLIN